MTKTDEEIKKAIVRYLDNTAKRRSFNILDFTLKSISEELRVEERRVEKLLEELTDEEEVVKSVKIETDIYLPAKGSEKIEKSLRIRKLIVPVSPYLAFAVVVCAIWIATLSNIIAVNDAIVYVLFIGPISAYLAQRISKEFVRWKVTSEKKYEDITKLSKFSAYLTVLLVSLLIGYYLLSRLTGSEMRPDIVVGVVTTFITAIVAKIAYVIWKWS